MDAGRGNPGKMRKAGDVVTALFTDRYGPEFMENARSNAGLFSSWNELVSEVWPIGPDQRKDDIPAAAVHSRIKELERGMLLVEADHPGWIQILQTRQAELLSVVQRRYPELDIRGIAFRLGREIPPDPLDPQISPDNSEPENYTFEPARNSDQEEPGNEEFYAALKGLEKSMKKRNGL